MQAISLKQAAVLLPPLAAPLEGANRAVRTIDDDVIARSVRPRVLRKLDRFSQIGLTLMDGLDGALDGVDRNRTGLLIGNDLGGWGYVEEQLGGLIATHAETAINPYVATAWFPAAVQGEISIAHGLLGYSKTFSGGLLGAGLAIEHAVRRLLDGTLDLALAGGIEAPDADITVRALQTDRRVTDTHPASEAGCLIALRRVEDASAPADGPVAVLSFARRTAAQAIEDVAAALAGEDPIDLFLPAVAAGDARQATVEKMRAAAAARLPASLRSLNFAAHGDVGSAGFALALASAAGFSPLAPPRPASYALVLGTDFDGMFLAAAVRRGEGAAA
jgi:3-oxoacyl-(acyl-carrier-protein) synthase